jgi:hypothetical protein
MRLQPQPVRGAEGNEEERTLQVARIQRRLKYRRLNRLIRFSELVAVEVAAVMEHGLASQARTAQG